MRILGSLEVRAGLRPVPIAGLKPCALLCAPLPHANEVVSTTPFVHELWRERPPATSEKLVQGYGHALRKQLGARALVTQPPGYRLDVDDRAGRRDGPAARPPLRARAARQHHGEGSS